ncbi:hypothetical protein Daura_06070 [Dactylosporangium aurantiacum]|uniref:Uncharacterized protein n=1 Tax=Dactylosporangium aurantiacum TaxID=35754 RepID=A0A9Q9MNJ1_9ACTN|nr:hypothetical protein [Dactylosporangium aurantiacum]MDG6108827.1 hypothetical protein [Dactylosporangium aurantiacum]UWZ55767.1 hypothetical protein Daura_06070 [Dactylosporangium aurantiacum]
MPSHGCSRTSSDDSDTAAEALAVTSETGPVDADDEEGVDPLGAATRAVLAKVADEVTEAGPDLPCGQPR